VVFGQISKEPYVLGSEVLAAEERYTLDLRNVPVSQVVASVTALAQSAGFEVERRGGVVRIGKAAEAVEESIVYRPRYRSARYLADVVQSVTGARSVLARSLRKSEDLQGARPAMAGQGGQIAPAQVQGSPSSVEGQIDRSEVDQIAFSVVPKDAVKVRKLLADLDTPTAEIVLKAVVYEVGVNRADGSAVQLAVHVAGLSGVLAGNVLSGASLKFSSGGIEAVLSALDADSRFKSSSRPQLRVKDGVQARFSVGQDVPVVGQVQVDKNGNPVSSVEYKQSGVILTATPEIRQDVIELVLNQELSNFVLTKTGVNNSPTLIKRSVNTRLQLVPGEVVMLAGLEDETEDESTSRVPFLGWLVGQDRTRKRSEILVFIEAVKI